MRVDCNLQDKALEIVLSEQSKYSKKGKIIGKERLINVLLAELHERRILDAIIEPHLITNAEWKKFLKK